MCNLSNVLLFLSRHILRRPRLIALVWAAATVVMLALALGGVGNQGLFGRLAGGVPAIPGTESQIAADLIEEESADGPAITLAVHGLDPASPELAEMLAAARDDLSAIAGVESVVDPTALPEGVENPVAAPLVAADGRGLLLIATLAPLLDADATEDAIAATYERMTAAATEISRFAPGAETHIGGTELVIDDIIDQIKSDLIRGEAIALPLSLVIMLVVFGGFMAAGMPLLGALSSIGAGLFSIFALTHVMEVDSSVVTIASVLGLGLAIDYSLLIVSRYREELRAAVDQITDDNAHPGEKPAPHTSAHEDPTVVRALTKTMTTAGRTVAFSALIVAISLSGLLVFKPSMLKAISIAAIAVVLVALLTGLTLVPALLVITGRRLLEPSPIRRVPVLGKIITRYGDTAPREGVFSRLATWTQRRPWLVVTGAVLILGILAVPVTHLQLRNSALEMLPADSPQRAFITLMTEQYPQAAQPEITVVADASVEEAEIWANSLADLDQVEQVFAPQALDSYVAVALKIDPGTERPITVERSVVETIRADRPGFETWVTGTAAHEIDFTQSLRDGAPAALAIVIIATLVLLFLMTGSVVLPFKALIINVFSIAAALGVLVWGFQDGHLENLLGFASTGGIETYVLAVVVAFGFGLAMDYEVFLLSRIQEAHETSGDLAAGASDDAAVRIGLQRSGRIITAAALILVIVFSGFALGELQVIKQAGIALAVAIAVDATIVRMFLVPATMTLLGKWNWWSPAKLRSLHAKIGFNGSNSTKTQTD
ncbi:MAG TPA: MMPL family transporter [Actinomycetales bacterium]|nr:MMPL family transporter [Actinomycetales bacterium]